MVPIPPIKGTRNGWGNIPRSPTFEGIHFPQAPDVLAAIDAMVSSAMIGAAANQASKQTKAMVKKNPPLIPNTREYNINFRLMNLVFFLNALPWLFWEASSCVMANIFFSLPLLMATESHLPRRPGILIFWVGWLYPEETIGDANCQDAIVTHDHKFHLGSLFWSFTWYNGMVWVKHSTAWRNWDLRINDPGK